MSNAKALRLRVALQEYVDSMNGDTGSRRVGGSRRQIPEADRNLVKGAELLLGQLSGTQEGAGDGTKRDTPGSRARDRGATTGANASAGWGNDAAKALFGVPGEASPNNGGTTT